MDERDTGGKRCQSGKIISLAQFIEDHGEALNYDLMTRTNYQLDDIGGALSWSSLYSFINYLGGDSALARSLGKTNGWESTLKTNVILADIYDMLQALNANFVAYATRGKKKLKIKPYPRPGRDDDNVHKIGKGALPVNDLHKWIKERQKHG